jgi:MoxR-like ATPase
MTEFKTGDRVRCVASDRYAGCGWRLGHEFIATEISDDCVFGGIDRCGVYFHALELVNTPKPEIKTKKTKEKKVVLSKIKLTRDDIIGQDDNKRMLQIAIKYDMPVLLIGETGTGKTTIIREQANLYEKKWARFNLTGETTVDEFVGKYELEGGQTVWRDGILLQAMKEGKWLIVDEINVALPEILFVLHSLLDDDKMVTVAQHSGEVVKPHEDFRFFATMNPCDEYAGTKELNKAFQSRFNMILILDYPDSATESKIVKDKADIDDTTASMMADVAIALREAKSKDKIYYTCSTRDLIYWGNLVNKGLDTDEAFKVSVLNKAPADKDAIREIYKAITGRYISLDSEVGGKLSVEYLEAQFKKLKAEKKAFENTKQDLREQIAKEILDNLKPKEPVVADEGDEDDEAIDLENIPF